MTSGKVSVVISARNEGDYLIDTVNCILQNSIYADLELIVVDDGSVDGSGERLTRRFAASGQLRVLRTEGVGVGAARNVGAQAAEGDILVFLDGHCYTPRGWLGQLVAPLQDPSVGMVGPAFASLSHDDGARGVGITWSDASLQMQWLPQQAETPYPVPLLPGGCQAMRREDFERYGAFESRMTSWGSEGEEQSLRVWLMGYQVIAVPQVVIYHLFRDAMPYPVEPVGVIFNRLLTALIHFSLPRVASVIDHYKSEQMFSSLIIKLMESDVMAQRHRWCERRVHDDDWFFARFKVPF